MRDVEKIFRGTNGVWETKTFEGKTQWPQSKELGPGAVGEPNVPDPKGHRQLPTPLQGIFRITKMTFRG